jgi:Histidine kinase
LLRTQDEERRRIARELHDVTAQSIGLLMLNLAQVKQASSTLDEQTKYKLLESMVIFAIRDGLKDEKVGLPPYFYALFYDAQHRRAMLQEGWHSIAKVFTLAILLDAVFQLIVFRWIYPFEDVLVAFLLALVPYTLIRGPVNRIARSLARKSVQKVSR